MAPAISAFVLSFVIILITWVNHHEAFRLVSRSSASFIYANGVLLLTVVIMPFPTALVGEYVLTDHAAPAVVIFNAVTVRSGGRLDSGGRGGVEERNRLTRDEKSTAAMRGMPSQWLLRPGVLYSVLALVAFWFPLTIAMVTTMLWAYWLVFGLRAG